MKFFRQLYLANRFFQITGVIVVMFILSFVISRGLIIPQLLFYLFLAVIATDSLLLFRVKRGMHGERTSPDRLSNGDDNDIKLAFENFYSFPVMLRIFDELPHQFQKRDLEFS